MQELPDTIRSFVSEKKIGYLSTITPKGHTATSPVAYYFDGKSIYFGTPKSSAKLKFLKKNPEVSFTVDNGKLMNEAIGILVQGKAEIFEPRKMIASFKSIIPTMIKFSKKYPELFKFYTGSMDELPDDRKFYKYRLVRINPNRILHWVGYEFGRIVSKGEREGDLLQKISDETDPVLVAKNVKNFLGAIDSMDSDLEETKQMSMDALNVDDEMYGNGSGQETNPLDVVALFHLSVPLRRTGLAITRLGKGTAEDVATKTGQSRATESSNLNSLLEMNYIKRMTEDNKVIFYLEE